MRTSKLVTFPSNGRKPVETKKTFRVKHVRSYFSATNPPRANISQSMKWEE